MNQASPGKILMLYDRAHSGERLFLEALRIAAEKRCVLYIVGACESAPESSTPDWAPLPSDRVADDLINMSRDAGAARWSRRRRLWDCPWSTLIPRPLQRN